MWPKFNQMMDQQKKMFWKGVPGVYNYGTVNLFKAQGDRFSYL